jgi:two-component system sensor histidine kinase/response regulator
VLRRLAAAVLLSALIGLSSGLAGVLSRAGVARADTGVAAVAAPAPAVVVLASYHQGDAWTDQEVAGLLAGLKAADPALVPMVEYLDTKRFPDPGHLAFLQETLARKYRERPPALVIALDNPALDLLRTYPQDLFPGVPAVFAGVNGFRPEWLHERPGTTGVAEIEDIAGTLELALRLHPGTRRVLVIDDDTASGRAMRRAMQTIVPDLGGRVAVDFAPAVPFAELAGQLAALPPDRLVLILTYVTDAAGRVFSREESTHLIAAASPVPVYAMHATRLGHGIVGGLLLDGREHGAQAAALARRVLAGEDPAEIPVELSRSYPEFDDDELRRLRIAATALPPDSRVINRPVTFYAQYRGLVLGALTVLASLSFALLVLTLATLRARHAEAALRQAQERLDLAVQGANLGLYDANFATGTVYLNEGYERLLGYAPGEFQMTVAGWRGLIHPADRPRVEQSATQARRTRAQFEAEYRVRHRTGHWLWVLDRGHGFDWDADGEPRRRAGTLLDITGRKESEERIARLSRLYQTLSDTNQAIVRTTDETELFRQVCDIALRLAGFGLVWIGLADRAHNRVLPVAAAGAAAQSLRTLAIPLDPPPPPGATLAAAVLAAGASLVSNDWATDQGPGGGGEASALAGLGAVACLPLRRGGQPVGVLEVGAAGPGYFDAEVMALLEEMVQDLSYALDNLDRTRALAESHALIAAQKAFYEDILGRVQEGILATDAQQRVTYTNPAMTRIAGVPAAALLGRHALDGFAPETVGELRPLFLQAMETGAPTAWALQLVTPQGRDAWQAGWLLPRFGAAGYLGMICTVRDITAERTAQLALAQQRDQLEETVTARTAALRAAQEEQRLILESSASGLCGLAPDGTISFANPAACRLLGYPAEALVGAALHDLVHHSRPDGSPYPAAQCPMVAALRDGHTVRVDDEVFWRADGQAIPVIYSAHPMVRDAVTIGAVVSFLDITERRRLEERLRRLAGAVEGIAGVRDLAGLAGIVCAAARRLTGADGACLVLRDGETCRYVGEDAIGPLWAGRRFPLDASAAGWVIRHAAPLTLDDVADDPRVPPDLYEGTFVRGLCVVPVGRTQPLGAIGCYWAEPHRTRDEAVDLAQALADATAVGLANLDLIARLTEARATAEHLAQVKSLFLANMSHEIRTPMNAILGLAHLLHRGTRDPDQRDKLGKIAKAANHLLAILNDILDFSKIDAGRLELEECDVDLAAVLAHAAALVADEARAKGLELAVHLDPALTADPMLRGDPTRLTQLVLNYLANAVKFTERGTIALEAGIVTDGPDARLVRCAVRDTGPGIDPADQGRLFDAFEQLDPSTTRRHGGTGLGLAINRRLAERMGGAVGVQSRPGAGSTFWFTARLGRGARAPGGAGNQPTVAAADATDAAELALRRTHPGARVLLAEDNPINQEVALELLRGAGLHADLAADGAQAVALARAAPYDLILMDVQMPVLDGLEATAAIRDLPGYGATPILALTANAFGEDRARCLAAGMNDHVGKPVDPAVLFAALLRWLPPGAALPIPAADAGAAPAAGTRAAATGTEPGSAAPLARLAAIPGLDTALALRHLAGRVERLAHLLRVFADSHREAPARLRERLDCGDGDGARRIAHGLKGAAATLGATVIQAQALDLELALRDGRPRAELEPRIARLEETLATLLDALRAALDPGTASEGCKDEG